MSMDVMHFRNDAFNISVDTDADQEDKRLHQELKQLIAEQFEDFDLGDDPDTVSDSRCVSNDEDADALDNDKLELNTEEIASINAAGKLSLLEGAIQKFGDDDTQASGDTLTDHLPARSLGTLEGFQPNPPIHVDLPRTPPYGPVIDSNNSNPNVHLETRDHDHWPKSPDVHKHIEATKAPTLIQNGGVREPYFVDETINWELSLPGEVGNALFLALQNNRDTPVESVQATERCAQKTEADVSTSESVTCAQSGSPVVASGTLQRLFPGIFNEPPLGAQNTQNVGYLNKVFPGASRVVSRWTVNESTNSVSVGDIQPLPDHSLPAQTSQDAELPHLPFNPEERRELLYTARGHQVEQLTTEVGRLREEIAKEKRLASHRAVLAEGERETLCAKLTASEKLVQSLRADLKEHEDQVNKLRQRLTESETCKNELNTEITNLRSTNESLSTQLVELTTGDALRRVEAREGKLTEALERRYATVAEEVKEELTIANRRIAEKEKEIVVLQRQIEVYKLDLKKAQEDFNDSLRRANQQLEESQQHCQKLASSALCSEVTSLREKVSAFEMSKKISDDVNAILQDELRDLRDQVGIYERMLRLDEVPIDDPFSRGCGECRPSSRGPHQHDMEKEAGENHLPELSTFHLPETHTYRGQLTSRLQNYGTDCQGSDEYNDLPSDTNRRRAHFAHSDPVPGAETQPTPSTFGLSDQSGFHSLTRQGVLTSTPALPAHSVMARLRSELERCLISYKAKREQITKLHETLFTTRCQLHQATEAAQKAEKNATMLQDRVLSLEREVASNRELNETPGPRESALSGQLDRLKQDYAQLESELQTTRSRLQTALGAEARALENEKTASERLAASTAERDAAVDRARAVCEAHYTAMRRRLEVDWANERESIERISEERLSQVRQELTECQAKLDHLTKMYKEAQATTHEAMENALREAMKERESDRMRFWREELPQQLESARQMWEQEWSELRDTAIRQAVEDCEKRLRASPVTNIGFESVGLSESQPKIVGHVGTSTELVTSSTCASQTETQLLLSLSVTDEPNTSSTDPPDTRTRVLHKFLSLGELRSLRIQLLETESINLDTLDGRFHTFLEQRYRLYAEQSWQLIALSFNKLLDEFHLKEVVSSKDDSTDSPSFMNEVFPRALSEYAFLGSEKSDTTAELPRTQSVHHASEDLGNSDFHPSIRDALDSAESWPIRDKVLLRLRKLVQTLYRMNNTQTQSDLCGQVNKSGQINPDLYQATLGKIKREVLNYVQMCQARAAETLHSELARVHRRACRQFTNQLRRTLCMTPLASRISSLVLDSDVSAAYDKRRQINDAQLPPNSSLLVSLVPDPSVSCGLKEASSEVERQTNSELKSGRSDSVLPSLESLLCLIDQVCASTERKFHPDSVFTSRELHLSGGGESSHPHDVSQVFSPITNSLLTTPNNTPPVSSALQHSLSADVGSSPTGDLQPESSLEFQSVTTKLRKIPSRTHTKVAWIQLQPHRSLSAKSHSPSRGSGAEVGLVQSRSPRSLPPPSIILSCASVSSTQPSNTLHDQLSVIPAPTSTSSRHDRPIPAPRSVKTARPGIEPTYRANFAQLTNDCPDSIHCPTVVCTDPGRRRVHTELYNLFEQFSTPEK